MNRQEFLKISAATAMTLAGSAILGGCGPPAEKRDSEKKENPVSENLVEDSSDRKTNQKEDGMKILVLTGSPRPNGNSNTLAEHFIRGAKEAGHTVVRFDAALRTVHPCDGCNTCGMNGPCVFQDDFAFVRQHIVDADLVAFATPMYYFGISAQLKAVIDRFYSINGQIHVPKKAVLMMTYADHSQRKESAIVTHYEVLLEYLGWTDVGQILVPGVWPVGAVNHTKFPAMAYQLGKSLKF
ncbi:MAG: flavodoxin family protein [Planctomycetia bacterium]|nr:flavodoxin family protein [Planctomycetia bacterium]